MQGHANIKLFLSKPAYLHRVTYARYRIDTTDSPDDEHMVAGNM